MSGLGRALFSGPTKILINELADELARADVQRLTAAIMMKLRLLSPFGLRTRHIGLRGFISRLF